MWYPIFIKFTNLFSHIESEYFFQADETTVIFGENKTDRGFQNNGSGKTTLPEAVSIAYTGVSLRDFTKEEFINYDADECEIEFYLENKHLGKSLNIYRKFFRGSKSSIVRLTENKIVNNQLTSVNEANKRIIETIGVTKEDFLHYYLISQDSRYNFFGANDSDKKEIMNRITSADMVNPALKELERRLKEKNSEYNTAHSESISIQSKIDLIIEQISEIEEQSETKNEIKELKVEIKELEASITVLKKQEDGVNKNIKNLQWQLDTKSNELEGRKTIKAKIKKINDEISEAEALSRKLNSILLGVITCPDCGSEFIQSEESEIDVEETRSMIPVVDESIITLETQLETQEKKLEKFKKLDVEVNNITNEINTLKRTLSHITPDITEYNRKIERKEKEIEKLENKKEDDKLTNLETKKVELSGKLDDSNKILMEIEEELNMIKFWIYYMGRSGFTTFLANKSVKLIEGVTNSFLRKFKTDVSVLINGFKVLKDGAVREKIDVFVQNNGLQAKKFLANSGGERGRVVMAGILGIHRLLNMSTDGGGLNLLMLDEVMHGVDSKGNENMIKILEKIDVTIVLITQNINDDFNVENGLYVEKVGGVSKYVHK